MFPQDTLRMRDVYIDNDLVYKMSGERFTGVVQSKRKNGHLVYEEVYNDGIILYSNLYFNTKEKKISDRTIYYRYKLAVIEQEIRFNLSQDTLEVKSYNEEEQKILLKQFENNKITYTCQYKGRKKHGLELGYLNGGEKITYQCQYILGKKHGEEFCINQEGEKWVKKFKNGKRVR